MNRYDFPKDIPENYNMRSSKTSSTKSNTSNEEERKKCLNKNKLFLNNLNNGCQNIDKLRFLFNEVLLMTKLNKT